MENVAFGFADRPKARLAIIATPVLPEHDRSVENPGSVVKAEAALAQGSSVPGFVPFKLHRAKDTLQA